MIGPLTSLTGMAALFISAWLGSAIGSLGSVFLMGVGIGMWLEHDPR